MKNPSIYMDYAATTPIADAVIEKMQACLGFAKSQPEINRIVVGIDSLKHLQEILVCLGNAIIDPPASLMCDDLDLINPSRWSFL